MTGDISLRLTFNEYAYLYDKARPACPDKLIDELVKQTNLNTNSKLLEIGPGTGQATMSFAKRGFDITAIEIGNNLAEILRTKLKSYPNAKVVTGAFEEAELPTEHFDLIYAASSFHWIKTESKFNKTYQLLKPAGFLAIIKAQHISGDDDGFSDATQSIYSKYWKNDAEKPFRQKKLNEVEPAELDTNLYESVYFNCFPVTINYSADEFCDLLYTESEKIALPREKRIKFVNEIWRLIYKKFNNSISRSFANSLTIARKKLIDLPQ